MSFLHPEFLYLMLPPVLLLFYFILTQKAPMEQLFDSAIYARLRVNEKRLTLRQRNVIYLLVFILLIVAMAQPVIEEGVVKVRAPERTITIALDISASMQSNDLYPSRLGVARNKLLRLLDALKDERVRVLAFGKDVYVLSPASRDRQSVRSIVERFNPGDYAEEGTDIMGLLAAADKAMEQNGTRNLLLMTDGGDRPDLKTAAAFAKANRIRLFVLATGTPQGAPLYRKGRIVRQGGKAVRTALNPALESLALSTGGEFALAKPGASEVIALLKSIRTADGRTQTGEKEVKLYGQLFILPLGLAILLLLVATSSISKRETVAIPPAVLLGIFLMLQTAPLKAEQFAFELLEDAKRYYEKGEYPKAANAYYRYARRKGNDARALYNSAHALYRQQKYAAAAALWSEIHTKDRLLQYAALHNLGNAHAMIGGEEHLNAAIKAYGKALHLQNDPQTRENLEIVRGRLMRLMRAKLGGTIRTGAMPKQRESAGHEGTQAVAGKAKQADATAKTSGAGRPSEGASEVETAQMSDYEARQWVKMLRKSSGVHLYRITPQRAKGAPDVAPW